MGRSCEETRSHDLIHLGISVYLRCQLPVYTLLLSNHGFIFILQCSQKAGVFSNCKNHAADAETWDLQAPYPGDGFYRIQQGALRAMPHLGQFLPNSKQGGQWIHPFLCRLRRYVYLGSIWLSVEHVRVGKGPHRFCPIVHHGRPIPLMPNAPMAHDNWSRFSSKSNIGCASRFPNKLISIVLRLRDPVGPGMGIDIH